MARPRHTEPGAPPALFWRLRQAGRSFRALYGLPIHEREAAGAEDGGDLAAWAQRHRVESLLRADAPNAGRMSSTAAFGRAHHEARWTAEAERLFGLVSPSIPALALVKGPGLAVQAWPETVPRSFDDLDFLCTRPDFHALVKAMREAGYLAEEPDSRRLAHRWHYGWGVSFQHPDGFRMEANHRFFPPHFPWPRGLDARRGDVFQWVRLDAAEGRIPSPALHLLLCTAHAVWHGWTRLAWIVDIAGLLARHPDAYLEARDLAGSCRFAQRALESGGAVAEAIFGPGLCPASAPEPVIREAIALLDDQADPLQGRVLRAFHEHFMTRPERTGYRLRRAFIPGDGDIRWLALPPALRGLYWLLRPVRGILQRLRRPTDRG